MLKRKQLTIIKQSVALWNWNTMFYYHGMVPRKVFAFSIFKELIQKIKGVCVWSMKLHPFIPLCNASLKGLPQILFLSILGNAGERIVYILEHTGNVHYLILWGKENFWWMGLKNYSLIKRTNIKEIQFVTQVRPSTELFYIFSEFFFLYSDW